MYTFDILYEDGCVKGLYENRDFIDIVNNLLDEYEEHIENLIRMVKLVSVYVDDDAYVFIAINMLKNIALEAYAYANEIEALISETRSRTRCIIISARLIRAGLILEKILDRLNHINIHEMRARSFTVEKHAAHMFDKALKYSINAKIEQLLDALTLLKLSLNEIHILLPRQSLYLRRVTSATIEAMRRRKRDAAHMIGDVWRTLTSSQ